MSMTPNDIVRELRKTRPRSWFIKETGGVLTHAKVTNLEKGRVPSQVEVDVITDLANRFLSQQSVEPSQEDTQPLPVLGATTAPPTPVVPSLDILDFPLPTATTVPTVVTPGEALSQADDSLKAEVHDTLQQLRDRLHRPPVPQLADIGTQGVTLENVPVKVTMLEEIEPNTFEYVEKSYEASTVKILPLTPTDLTSQDGIPRFGNSEIATYKGCKRRWWLSNYRNLELKTSETSVLGVMNTGLRVHDALRRWYVPEGEMPEDPRDVLNQLIIRDWQRLQEQYADEDFVPPEIVKLYNTQTDTERAMIMGYMEWLEETGVDAEFAVTGSEQYVEADLSLGNGQPVKLIGRLDVRVKRKSNGDRLFIDHKTVGDFASSVQVLPLNEQMKHYMLLELLQNVENADERVTGAVYNMLRRVKRGPAAKPPFFQRVEVHHNKHEIENFKAQRVGEISDMVQTRAALDNAVSHHIVAPPTPTRDCAWKCQFFKICPMFNDGSRVEDAINDLYQVTDPYKYYADERDVVG
jgi:hypothetical protein